jgi:hypothetical protein
MNAKDVLSKISKMLNLSDEITLTEAKSADGAILSSPTFDLGESVDVVSEDGTKTPAPDGEHQIALKDSEGNEVIIRVVTKDGTITERENVEEAENETELEMVPVEEIPQASGDLLKVNETPTQKNSVESGTQKMAEATDTAEPITEDENAPTKEMPTEEVDMGKMMDDMSYRIGEMEAKIAKMEEAMMPPVNSEVTEEVAGVKMSADPDEEEELPKLDGAPVEEATRFSNQNKNNYGKKVNDSQSSFLSKLYN